MILIFANVSALICLSRMFGCFVLKVTGGVVGCWGGDFGLGGVVGLITILLISWSMVGCT